MNITRDWINEYLTEPVDVDALEEALERVGFPCEEREAQPTGDVRLDIEITSNRGDCVSVLGLAREYAAATGAALTPPDCSIPPEFIDESASASEAASVTNEEHDLCPYYSARIIRGIAVGPSPDWLRKRIESIGLRPVNNVVDVTNFILHELGQPLHTFDLNKLNEKRIIVRRANRGERLVAIDGSNLTLDESMLVIADAKVPVAVAGVMGGLDSEVGDRTTDILLEAASFNPLSVRTTSRALKLFSDSSYRFERGVHPAMVAPAADRAARLIAELAGGTILRGDVVAGAPVPEPLALAMRPARCRKIAGADIATNEMIQPLEALGLDPAVANPGKADERIDCTVPPHRLDLEREIDLIEEIVRLHGFDRFKPHDRLGIDVIGEQPEVVNRVRVEETLAALGFFEVVTHSFISENHARPFLPEGFEALRVADERRRAEPILRPSVIPSLLACRKRNQDTGHRDARFFEQAACFGLKAGEKLENVNLAILLDAPDRQHGLRELRAAIDAVVGRVVGSTAELVVRPVDIAWYEPEGGAVLMIGDDVLGTMGVIHPSIQSDHDLQTPVAAAEIGIARYFSRVPEPAPVTGLSMHPAIQRDLSVVIDEEIAWSKIADVVSQVEMEHLEALDFVGVYRGKQVGSGRKSVTMRLTFRAPDRTLRHDEVDPQISAVVERLAKETGAALRE